MMPSTGNNNPQDTVLPAVMTPEVIAMRKELLEQLKGSSKDDLQIEHPKDWTQEELLAAMKERERTSDPVMKDQMFRLEREWFDNAYGTQQVEYDETGKMKQPRISRTIATKPKSAKTKDGKDLNEAIGEVVDRLPYKNWDFMIERNAPFYNEEKGGWYRFDPKTGKHLEMPNYKGPQMGQARFNKAPSWPVDHALSGNKPAVEPDISQSVVSKPAPEIVKGLQAGLNMMTNKQNQSPLPSAPKQVKTASPGRKRPLA